MVSGGEGEAHHEDGDKEVPTPPIRVLLTCLPVRLGEGGFVSLKV